MEFENTSEIAKYKKSYCEKIGIKRSMVDFYYVGGECFK